jgi:hypothetical protein
MSAMSRCRQPAAPARSSFSRGRSPGATFWTCGCDKCRLRRRPAASCDSCGRPEAPCKNAHHSARRTGPGPRRQDIRVSRCLHASRATRRQHPAPGAESATVARVAHHSVRDEFRPAGQQNRSVGPLDAAATGTPLDRPVALPANAAATAEAQRPCQMPPSTTPRSQMRILTGSGDLLSQLYIGALREERMHGGARPNCATDRRWPDPAAHWTLYAKHDRRRCPATEIVSFLSPRADPFQLGTSTEGRAVPVARAACDRRRC